MVLSTSGSEYFTTVCVYVSFSALMTPTAVSGTQGSNEWQCDDLRHRGVWSTTLETLELRTPWCFSRTEPVRRVYRVDHLVRTNVDRGGRQDSSPPLCGRRSPRRRSSAQDRGWTKPWWVGGSPQTYDPLRTFIGDPDGTFSLGWTLSWSLFSDSSLGNFLKSRSTICRGRRLRREGIMYALLSSPGK